jgi:hypothetical protein
MQCARSEVGWCLAFWCAVIPAKAGIQAIAGRQSSCVIPGKWGQVQLARSTLWAVGGELDLSPFSLLWIPAFAGMTAKCSYPPRALDNLLRQGTIWS